jgi:hypothetical protein
MPTVYVQPNIQTLIILHISRQFSEQFQTKSH